MDRCVSTGSWRYGRCRMRRPGLLVWPARSSLFLGNPRAELRSASSIPSRTGHLRPLPAQTEDPVSTGLPMPPIASTRVSQQIEDPAVSPIPLDIPRETSRLGFGCTLAQPKDSALVERQRGSRRLTPLASLLQPILEHHRRVEIFDFQITGRDHFERLVGYQAD